MGGLHIVLLINRLYRLFASYLSKIIWNLDSRFFPALIWFLNQEFVPQVYPGRSWSAVVIARMGSACGVSQFRQTCPQGHECVKHPYMYNLKQYYCSNTECSMLLSNDVDFCKKEQEKNAKYCLFALYIVLTREILRSQQHRAFLSNPETIMYCTKFVVQSAGLTPHVMENWFMRSKIACSVLVNAHFVDRENPTSPYKWN